MHAQAPDSLPPQGGCGQSWYPHRRLIELGLKASAPPSKPMANADDYATVKAAVLVHSSFTILVLSVSMSEKGVVAMFTV